MNIRLKISICVNLVLLGGLFFSMSDSSWRRTKTITAPPKSVVTQAAVFASQESPPRFQWSQLESTNDYRHYVASLRASGCPEATVQDIVRGDAKRAFAFKRLQLGLDGSGSGAWSQFEEAQLTASLLGENSSAAETSITAKSSDQQSPTASLSSTTETVATQASADTPPTGLPWHGRKAADPVYPLAFRRINLDAAGFGENAKAAISQVQQQFVNDIGGPNQNPSDPAYLARWQSAQVKADETLRGLLGNQAYMAYQQQQYYAWYQPQVAAASAGGKALTINPALFSKQK
jgi:hypothetical protein